MKRSEPPGKRSKASGCDTKNPPPGYNIELRGGKTQWEKCKEYWNKAKRAVEEKSFRNDIEQQSAIKIIKKRKRDLGVPGKGQGNGLLGQANEFICYNQNFLEKRGWCEIEASTALDRKWGICSTSCKHYPTFKGPLIHAPDITYTPDIVPVTYHEMDLMAWKCQNDEAFRQDYLDRGFTNAALLCSRPIYPKQKIWNFERDYKIPGVLEKFSFKGSNQHDVELPMAHSMFYSEDHDKMKLPYGNEP